MHGGSFNPIHNGHLRLGRKLAEIAPVDKVLLIPSNVPPHKAPNKGASAQQRLEMCKIAVDHDPLFEVSDMEIQRGGTSYTIDTLRELQEKNQGAELYLFMGSDMFLSFDTWKDYQAIFDIATICVASREDRVLSEVLFEKAERLFDEDADKIIIASIPPYIISSSIIRARVANGEDISRYVPEGVVQYIEEEGLYRE